MEKVLTVDAIHQQIMGLHSQKRETQKKPIALVIDDDVWMQRILNNYLNGWGFDTVLASNGFEGLESAIKYNPTIIFLDLIMPEMKGDMVLKVFKNLPYTNEIPIIIVSSNIDHNYFGTTYKEGAIGFMTKPFTQPVLFRRMEECLPVEVLERTELKKYSESLKAKKEKAS